MKRRYRKALAVLALAACLWALPAAAEAPAAEAPAPEAAETENETAAQGETAGGSAGGLTTATGGAALVGMGAYSYLRKQRQDERDRKRAEPGEILYFENHTRNGTLRPEERDDVE